LRWEFEADVHRSEGTHWQRRQHAEVQCCATNRPRSQRRDREV